MDIDAAYPSKYLKASDLQGRQPTVTIDRVIIEEVGRDKESRPVIYFTGKDKGMVLNRTNANSVASIYGKDTDGWIGRPVTLFVIMTEFNRNMVEALRLKPAPVHQQAQQPRQPAPPIQQPPRFENPSPPAFEQVPDYADDIPF